MAPANTTQKARPAGSPRPVRVFLVIIILMSLLLSNACNKKPTPTPQSPTVTTEPPTPPPTTVPTEITPTVAPAEVVKVQLLLPDFSDPERKTISTQLDDFKKSHPKVVVEVMYEREWKQKLNTMLAAGSPPAIAAVDVATVVEYMNSGSILPATEIKEPGLFLDALTRQFTYQKMLFAYPWFHYDCFPYYYNFVIFNKSHPDVVQAAQQLGAFLTSEDLQRKNSTTAYPINDSKQFWYPTLIKLYTGPVTCPAFGTVIVPDGSLNDAIKKEAARLSEIFSGKYKVQFNQNRATGVSTSKPKAAVAVRVALQRKNAQTQDLASAAMPAIDNNQYVDLQGKHLKVVGALSLFQQPTIDLPIGEYIIACDENTKQCSAVDQQEKMTSLPNPYTDGLPIIATPEVYYVNGSICIDYYWEGAWYQVCIF